MAAEQTETVPVPKWIFTMLAIFMPVLTALAGAGVKVQWDMRMELTTLSMKADQALEMQEEINVLRRELRDLERAWDRKFGNPTE